MRRKRHKTGGFGLVTPKTSPKKPRRKMVSVTGPIAEHELLVVFTLDGFDYGDNNMTLESILKEAKRTRNDAYADSFEICVGAAQAMKVATRYANRGYPSFVAHVCTMTEKKLEKWPGAGC